jgi:hypothetical protein
MSGTPHALSTYWRAPALAHFGITRPSRVRRGPINIPPPHFRFPPCQVENFSEPLGRSVVAHMEHCKLVKCVSHNTNDIFVVGKCTQQWPKAPLPFSLFFHNPPFSDDDPPHLNHKLGVPTKRGEKSPEQCEAGPRISNFILSVLA